jgi:bacillaene synthase trans-acting acyltransferase
MTQRPLVFMFSGQGSQYFQMGKELFGQNRVFRETMERADALTRSATGLSLIDGIYGRARSETFDDLRVSHPALIATEYALLQALRAEGIVPDQVWGSSLGELVAAIAADVWSFESALAAVMRQAALVQESCPSGGMLAVLGEASMYAELERAVPGIAFAGVNFDKHFTIAANNTRLDAVQDLLKPRNVVFQRLPVCYAFHSAAVDGVAQVFVDFCNTLPIADGPKLPMISGMTGDYVVRTPPRYFWDVVREPMRFKQTMDKLEATAPSIFIDCGPSGTAATFAKYNLSPQSRSACFPLLTPFQQGVQKIEQLKVYLQDSR